MKGALLRKGEAGYTYLRKIFTNMDHFQKISIQHPLATVELVAWDSSLTLFISKEDTLVEKFRSEFPLSVDLEAYNKRELDDSDAYDKWLENAATSE